MTIAATGNAGSKNHPGPEIKAIRTVEAQKGSDAIGAEMIMLGYKDGEFWQDNQTWKKYIDLIRRTNPDVIITHDRNDYVHDYSNVGEMVYRAAIWVSVTNIPGTRRSSIDHIPTVFRTETVGMIRVAPPDLYADIAEEFEQKMEAYGPHKSQYVDFVEKIRN